jgi:hypothetical protein
MKNDQHLKEKETELDFRIRFKNEYGVDYKEAIDNIREKQQKRDRWWHSLSVLYKWKT